MVFPYASALGLRRETGMGLRSSRRVPDLGESHPSARHWRHLVHRHGSNLLGGLMAIVMLYAVVLTVLAS
jgi:hypothetical protein